MTIADQQSNHQINNKPVVDCTNAEEQCSESSVSISVNKSGKICKIQTLQGCINTIQLSQYISVCCLQFVYELDRNKRCRGTVQVVGVCHKGILPLFNNHECRRTMNYGLQILSLIVRDSLPETSVSCSQESSDCCCCSRMSVFLLLSIVCLFPQLFCSSSFNSQITYRKYRGHLLFTNKI